MLWSRHTSPFFRTEQFLLDVRGAQRGHMSTGHVVLVIIRLRVEELREPDLRVEAAPALHTGLRDEVRELLTKPLQEEYLVRVRAVL